MEPIVLTAYGETLLEYPSSNPNYRHSDESRLSSCIGVHEVCTGWVDLKPISKTHNAICCRVCGRILVIPKEVDTFGKLRDWCAREMKEQQRRYNDLQLTIDRNRLIG